VAEGDLARDATREVGAELRRLAELLADRDPPVELLQTIAEDLRAVGVRLTTAPRRARPYETAVDAGDAAAEAQRRERSRAYHDELGPLRGVANPVAPPLRFGDAVRPGAVAATARLGALHEGPPRLVHGGWLAALFDEVLAVLQRDAGVDGATAELTVRFRRPTPVGAELHFEGWIEQDLGRSVIARAECRVDGQVVAEAEARFVRGALRRDPR